MRTAVAWLCVVLVLAGCSDADSEPEASPSGEPRTSEASPTAATSSPDVSPLPTADPASLGFDAKVLERLAKDAKDAGSTCLLVARDGVVAGEWYWNDGASDKPQEVFSVTKSVTSTLVGLAQADGALDLADRAATYIPEWQGTPSRRVTVRNLLSNDSGRFWSPESDYQALLQARDRTAYAVGLEQAAPPGTVWAYNNAAIQTLDRVIRNATGTATDAYAQERLFAPLGMTSTRMTPDASGRSTQAFFGMQSTCPDLARFGQLFEQRGEWEGEQLLPAAWVDDATGRSSQELNAAYGLLWWVNRVGPQRQPVDDDNPGLPPGVSGVGQLVPGAPEDLYAALGFGGQVVLVDPGSGTVVVRLGTLGTGAADGAAAYTVADAARVVTEALTE
ncbi:serine hydrolase domain-containing protein [Nocardioides dilutus]